MIRQLASLTLAACTLPAFAQSPTPIPQLDLNRITGTWYEVAHLPNKSQAKCISDPVVLYALDDKPSRLQIVNSCKRKDSSINVSNSTGRAARKIKPGQTADGRLKIPFFLPYVLAKKYWFLALADDNSWALVGSPNHKSLQLLAKTPTIPAATLAELQSRAAAQGYATAKLIQLPATK